MLNKNDEHNARRPQASKKPAPLRFKIIPAHSIVASLVGAWLIKHLLPSRGLAVIYGPPGSGKSFLALHAAFHIAMGEMWAGKKTKQGAIIYIAAEGGHGFGNRVVAARIALDVPEDTPLGIIYVAPNLGSAEGDVKLLIQEIEAQCRHYGWEVAGIFIDTLARAMCGADENSTTDMGNFVRNVDLVASHFKCLGVAVHHTGKDTDRGMRGSSALHGAADTEWEITENEDGTKTVRTAKQKDGAPADLTWKFELPIHILGEDEDGEKVSSCVARIISEVKQKERPKSASKRKLKGQKALLLKAVARSIEDTGEFLPASSHMPGNTRGVQRQSLENYTDMMGFKEGTSERVQRSMVDKMLRELAGDGFIGRWGKHIWMVSDEANEAE
jgi:hypothetical protein